jgi:endonuclease/exonuclease/phosphatase family metal-dependent hydrolase
MRLRAAAALVVVAAAAIAMRPRATADPNGTLTVMTFNLQHGLSASGKYNLQRAVDTIARVQPDLVGVQEITRNHPYYNCDDQPAKMAEGLRAATGRAWSVVYEQEWFTPNVECRDSGRGDGKETEGLAFFAPEPLGPATTTPLPVSRIALTVKPPSFGGTAVTVTHLASGKTNGPARAKEVDALLKWSGKLGPSQIMVGDFNLAPDAPELQPMLTVFRDAWTTAKSEGTASGAEGTHGASRIDFVFVKGDALTLTGTETVDTAGWFGTAVSDHRPLVARFRVDHVVK